MRKFLLILFTTLSLNSFAQYTLVFEENFDGDSLNPAVWNMENNIGIWNTGSNRELQHYRTENVTVGSDSAGTGCLMITARKELYNGYQFTSGRINTKNKLAFKYGKLECRMKLPDLANGLWPAFWLLGNTSLGWPACGEIDIMEAGQKEGITNGTQNTRFGGALHWDNAGSYASYGTSAIAPTPLNEEFHTFTLEWTPTIIKMYLDSSATAYYAMTITGADAEEFRNYENYLVLNLAVGGMFPDLYTTGEITAPMPATLYIDYIKLYQQEGVGSFNNNMPVIGDLAVFADGKAYENSIVAGYDALIHTENMVVREGEEPKEGTEVLSYDVTGGLPFQFGIEALGLKNMTNFSSAGSLDFYIRTNITGDLLIGIADSSGQESWISLADSAGASPARDSSWHRVVLPLKDFDSLDLAAVSKLLLVRCTPGQNGFISIDKVLWSTTTVGFSCFGIYTDNPSITERFVIDNVTNQVFVWEGTMLPISGAPAYDGQNVLAFSSDATKTWYGFGVFAGNGLDFSQYADGYLHFALRTSSTKDFWVGMGGANSTEAKIEFKSGSDPDGFLRDGKWHQLSVPMSTLIAQGIDLSSCGNIFMLGGAPSISDILVDDIYLSQVDSALENTALNPKRDDPLTLTNNIISADYWGVYTENPNVTERFVIDNVKGFLYIWNNTMVATTVKTTYEGSLALQFRSNGSAGWYGFGLNYKNGVNLTHFASGYLSVALKTSSKNEFYVGVQGAANTEGKIVFKNGSDPYGFIRDGKWHQVIIPVSTLVSKGLDLTACGNIFMLGGTTITDIGIDDIVFGIDQNFPVNPGVHSAVENLSGTSHMHVFPGLVKSELFINPNHGTRIESLTITDMSGRTVLVHNPAPGEGNIVIQAGMLRPAMYLLIVKSNTGTEVAKFIKE
ncbi:MAG: family 16 glycosylhydrolase [Bacteroidales bacterium]